MPHCAREGIDPPLRGDAIDSLTANFSCKLRGLPVSGDVDSTFGPDTISWLLMLQLVRLGCRSRRELKVCNKRVFAERQDRERWLFVLNVSSLRWKMRG